MANNFMEKITLPVNPGYQWGHNPSLQAEYVNPVELSNRTIYLANAYSYASERVVGALKELSAAKNALDTAETALRDFERDILIRNPPPSADRNNNKLLEAYIGRIAEQLEKQTEMRDLRLAVTAAEAKVTTLQMLVDVWRARLTNIEMISTQIQTHLSYIKAERNHSRNYT